MKKILLLTISMLFIASSAWSLSVGLTDVGSVDTWIASAKLADSGDATELGWVMDVLNRTDLSLDAKTDNTESSWAWLQTNEDDRVYAFDFVTDTPEYFLVKTAPSSGFDHFLFRNDENFSWGVIDLDLSGIYEIKNVGKLSHIDEFNGTAPVPEPATMLLLGSGLIGIAGIRKRLARNN